MLFIGVLLKMMEYYNIALHFSTTQVTNNNKKNFCILQTWTHIIEAPPPFYLQKKLCILVLLLFNSL